MKTLEDLRTKHESHRAIYAKILGQTLTQYDLSHLMDLIFTVKTFAEQYSKESRSLLRQPKNDFFGYAVVCSRCLDESEIVEKAEPSFLDCWIPFRVLLEKLRSNEQALNDELLLSLMRLLFFAAVIFNVPEGAKLENIISDTKARPLPGTYVASPDEIAFSRTLPGDLSGPFDSISQVHFNLKTNLQFYLDQLCVQQAD